MLSLRTVSKATQTLRVYPVILKKALDFKYRSGTVNSKSFVGKVLLRIKWKFELINAL